MTGASGEPTPLLRLVGCGPQDGTRAPAPCKLALALREYAISQGLIIKGLARSRVRLSGTFHLEMADQGGRAWHMRISEHLRPRRTGHATPHLDLVSFDGASGLDVGCKLIDAIVAGSAPWFDAAATIRPLAQTRRNSRRRRR